MQTIRQEFLEAKQVLEAFLADEDQFSRIEKAGALMTEALRKGKLLISCGNGGSKRNRAPSLA